MGTTHAGTGIHGTYPGPWPPRDAYHMVISPHRNFYTYRTLPCADHREGFTPRRMACMASVIESLGWKNLMWIEKVPNEPLQMGQVMV